MSSSDQFPDIPQTRDGAPNWAADTDPIGPVTPELALVDPGLTRGEIENEVTMSSMQFGDAQTPVEGQQAVPLQPLQPLQPLEPLAPLQTTAPAPEPTAPTPVEPGSAVPVGDMRDVPLGTLVFRAGLLPEERLEEALQEGMKTGRRLGEILLERGWVSEGDLGRLLAAQKGLPFVELDPSAIDPTAPPLLPAEKARLHGALPVGFEGGVPVVAVADPSNDLVVENVRRALACEPALVVAGRDALHRAINVAYGAQETVPTPESVAVEHVPAPPAVEVQPAPVVEPPAAPVLEPQAAPVLEPQAAPVLEPQAAPVLEPQAAPVVEPQAPPVFEPQAAPVFEQVAPVEPVAPVAAEPVVPVTPEPDVPVAPEPVVPSVPVAPPPVAEPVAAEPVLNGDGVWLAQPQEAVAAPVAAPEPVFQPSVPEPQVVQPEVASPPAAAAEPALAPTEPDPVAEPVPAARVELTHAVVLRLADGERIELGSFEGHAEAVEAARGAVAQITSEDGWPLYAGRFIRPEGIVSVDVVELEVSRWLGSQARAAAWTGQQQQPTGY